MDISTLIDDLGSSDGATRATAAEAISRHAEAKAAMIPLIRACGDPEETVREWAVAALEEIGPPESDELAAIAEMLNEPNGDSAYWAATLLGRAEAEAAGEVGALAACLDSQASIAVRQRAAWALRQIGEPAKPAIPALRRAANDGNVRLANLAQQAIDAIGP